MNNQNSKSYTKYYVIGLIILLVIIIMFYFKNYLFKKKEDFRRGRTGGGMNLATSVVTLAANAAPCLPGQRRYRNNICSYI